MKRRSTVTPRNFQLDEIDFPTSAPKEVKIKIVSAPENDFKDDLIYKIRSIFQNAFPIFSARHLKNFICLEKSEYDILNILKYRHIEASIIRQNENNLSMFRLPSVDITSAFCQNHRDDLQ